MPRLRSGALAASALALGLAGALVVAVPAFADDIPNDSIFWDDVSDDALEINDAHGYDTDLLGSGVPAYGWTYDAFDSVFYDIEATDGVDTLDIALTPVSQNWVPNGLSTIVGTGSVTFASTDEVEVTVTLEIQGSYARWTIASTVTGDADIRLIGDLGSDSSTTFLPLSASTLISHDEGYDPVIGYLLTGAAAFDGLSDGDGGIDLVIEAGGVSTLTVALQDYDPCSVDETIAEMTSRVASLNSSFGASYPLGDSRCVTVAPVASFATSEPTDQTLALTQVPSEADPSVGAIDDWWGGEFFTDDDVVLVTEGLPAGLTLTFDPEASTFHLTGSAAPGTYAVRVAIAFEDSDDDVPYYEYPVLTTLNFQVTGAELAATGDASALPVALSAGALLAGGLALMIVRRRSSRA